MLYKCNNCSYTTQRACDLRRHQSRKYPCNRHSKDNTCNSKDTNNLEPNTVNLEPNTVDLELNTVDLEPNTVNVEPDTVNVEPNKSKFSCSKCSKLFTRKDHMRVHEKKCVGLVDPRQCNICLKVFTSTSGRIKHKKNVKCKPPAEASSVVNNHTTINNINTTNNITTNINNINIRNDFYNITEADIERIVEKLGDKEYLRIVMSNLDIGRYAIPRTIEHIYFNKKHPDMQTLKKERRNDRLVDVHVGEGKWEKRFMDDVFKLVIRRVEDYHTKFFRYMEEKYKNVPVGSVRWKQLMRPVKTFGNMMLWYEGFRGDLIEGLGIELNYPDEDDPEIEKERERRNREMEQLMGEKLYDQTLSGLRQPDAVVGCPQVIST